MMLEYFARLALLLPLLGLLIWGSLRLTKYLQTRMIGFQGGGPGRRIELVETTLLAPGMKLAVVRFHGREILLGCSRQGLVRLSEAPSADPGALTLSPTSSPTPSATPSAMPAHAPKTQADS